MTTPEQEELIAYMGRSIMDVVIKLKKLAKPLEAQRWLEFYQMDTDFDIRVTVTLTPKLSQYERGMEMFK